MASVTPRSSTMQTGGHHGASPAAIGKWLAVPSKGYTIHSHTPSKGQRRGWSELVRCCQRRRSARRWVDEDGGYRTASHMLPLRGRAKQNQSNGVASRAGGPAAKNGTSVLGGGHG